MQTAGQAQEEYQQRTSGRCRGVHRVVRCIYDFMCDHFSAWKHSVVMHTCVFCETDCSMYTSVFCTSAAALTYRTNRRHGLQLWQAERRSDPDPRGR